MEQDRTYCLVLFLLHRAVGNAYREIVNTAKQGMLTDDELFWIESAAMETVNDKRSVPASLLELDNGTAFQKAILHAEDFFLEVEGRA